MARYMYKVINTSDPVTGLEIGSPNMKSAPGLILNGYD